MVLDKVHEVQDYGRGNTPCTVALDKAGSIILGVPHKKRITHSKTIVKGVSYITRSLPINYKHIFGVNKTEVDTIEFCVKTGNKLVRWEHEVASNFVFNGENITFIPDVFAEMELGGKTFLGFIEYDTGSENLRNKSDFPIIGDKLKNYKRYKRSSMWQEYYDYFPIIMLVTEDNNRIPYFNNKCKELGLKGVGVYHENYTDVLEHLANMV